MTERDRPFPANVADEGPADPTAVEPGAVFEYETPPAGAAAAICGPATYASVLRLALPIILERIFDAVIGLTDTWVAGNGIDPSLNAAASAAVGTMSYLQWLCGLMTSALGVGASAIVARSIGAGRPATANRITGTALTAAFIVGLGLAGFFYLFSDQMVRWCGLHGPAHALGVQYLQIMVFTVALQSAGLIGLSCLRGAGDTLRPMFIYGLIAVVNLITVPALAYGKFGLPALGIRGNALGTMIAFAICGLATMILLCSGWARLRLRARHFRVHLQVLWRILRIGLPSWAEHMLLWGGQFFIVLMIINRNDAALAELYGKTLDAVSGATMAAHTAVLRIESLAFLPGFGFGIAASTLVGLYLGAGRPEEARHAARIANRIALFTMTIVALPMVFFPSALLGWMIKDPHTVEIGRWPMVLAGLAQPGFAVAIIMAAGLRGAGETVWPMLATISGIFLVRFPCVLFLAWYLFPHLGYPALGLLAAWIGIFFDLNYRALPNGIVFRRGHWQHKRV